MVSVGVIGMPAAVDQILDWLVGQPANLVDQFLRLDIAFMWVADMAQSITDEDALFGDHDQRAHRCRVLASVRFGVNIDAVRHWLHPELILSGNLWYQSASYASFVCDERR